MDKIIISFKVAVKLHELGLIIPAHYAYDEQGKYCEASSPDAVYNAPSLTEMQEYANEEGVTGVEHYGNKFVGVYKGMRYLKPCNTRQDAYACAIIAQDNLRVMLNKFEKDLSEGLAIFGWTAIPEHGDTKRVWVINNQNGTPCYSVVFNTIKNSYSVRNDDGTLLQSGSADNIKEDIGSFLKSYIFLVPVGESLNEMDFSNFSYDNFVSGLSPAFIDNLNIDAIDLGITSFYASLECDDIMNFHASHSYYAIQTPDSSRFSIDIGISGYEKKYPVGTAKRFICSAYSLADIIGRLKTFSDKGCRWSVENVSEVDASSYMLREGLKYSAKVFERKTEKHLGNFNNPTDAYLAVYSYLSQNK